MMIEFAVIRLRHAIDQWRPPGALPAEHRRGECGACSSSAFADVACVRNLPPELRHSFLLDLERVARRVFEYFADRFEAELVEAFRLQPHLDYPEAIRQSERDATAAARRVVWDDLARFSREIDAARSARLEPRLAAFLADEALALESPPSWLPPLS